MPDFDNIDGIGTQPDLHGNVVQLTSRSKLEKLSPPSEWPEPDLGVLRLNRRAAPKLPLDVFGDRWAPWIENAAEAAASPPDYVAAALLSSASALIGHARWAQAWEGWAEPPHLWCAAVGDSGDSKSPGLDAIIKHVLPAIETRMAEGFPDRHKEALTKYEADKAEYEKWKKDIREAVEQGMSPPPAPDLPNEPPPEPRLLFSDVTIEKVALLMSDENSKGVLMYRDELSGWLLGMKAYNDGARGFWLEGYGGRQWTVDRVKYPEPIVIPRFATSWIGGIQPSRLAEVMTDADDGLLARFNWFWPEPIEFRRPKKTPDAAWAITALDRLRDLQMIQGETGPRPFFVHLHHRAADHMEVLGRELQERKIWTAGLMRSAVGKARGLVLRLSLVLEFLRWSASSSALLPSPEFISEESFDAAAKLVTEYLLPMAERTYGDAAASEEDVNTATLAAWIAKERPKEVHVRTMVRTVRLPDMREAKPVHTACEALIEAGWLGRPDSGERRRREAYPISPRIYEALGERQ